MRFKTSSLSALARHVSLRLSARRLSVRRAAGLSMTELAITIAIIGLLLAASVEGISLVKASKLKHLISELTGYESAVREFKETYRFYPGDIPKADQFWPQACAALPAGDCNGDGDGFVEFTERAVSPTTAGHPYEDVTAFYHLSTAQLISGSFTGQPSADARYALGQQDEKKANIPNSEAFPRAGYMLHEEYAPASGERLYNTRGLTLRVGSVIDLESSLRGLPYGGFLNAKDAFSVDKKTDDGKPASGRLYVFREYDDMNKVGSPSGCVTHTWNTTETTAVEFALSDDEDSCSLALWLAKR